MPHAMLKSSRWISKYMRSDLERVQSCVSKRYSIVIAFDRVPRFVTSLSNDFNVYCMLLNWFRIVFEALWLVASFSNDLWFVSRYFCDVDTSPRRVRAPGNQANPFEQFEHCRNQWTRLRTKRQQTRKRLETNTKSFEQRNPSKSIWDKSAIVLHHLWTNKELATQLVRRCSKYICLSLNTLIVRSNQFQQFSFVHSVLDRCYCFSEHVLQQLKNTCKAVKAGSKMLL